MRKKYPGEDIFSNQKNPDVCQDYSKSSFMYKKGLGIDYKNITGKTVMDGRNQGLIGPYERFGMTYDMYETTLFAISKNAEELKPILATLRELAKNNDWKGQLDLYASNIHKFPEKHLLPLYTKDKIHLDSFTSEVQAKILASKIRLKKMSDILYAKNVPENDLVIC